MIKFTILVSVWCNFLDFVKIIIMCLHLVDYAIHFMQHCGYLFVNKLFRAVRQAYLQNGGNDPDILSQLSQMRIDAQAIDDSMKNAQGQKQKGY